jgi:hypothetical protein
MLSHDGRRLLDGRNRERACGIAEVEPRFDRLPEGVDERAYIMSLNVKRRHLNAGQQALAVALAYPEKRQGKRTDLEKDSLSSPFQKTDTTTLAHAREIAAHADLAKQVMDDVVKFEHALAEARWRMANAKQEAKHQRRLAFDAPDLAEQVKSGELSLYAAMRQLDRRQAQISADRRKEREAWVSALQVVVAGWRNGMRADDTARALAAHALGIDPGRIKGALSGLDGLTSDDAATA